MLFCFLATAKRPTWFTHQFPRGEVNPGRNARARFSAARRVDRLTRVFEPGAQPQPIEVHPCFRGILDPDESRTISCLGDIVPDVRTQGPDARDRIPPFFSVFRGPDSSWQKSPLPTNKGRSLQKRQSLCGPTNEIFHHPACQGGGCRVRSVSLSTAG